MTFKVIIQNSTGTDRFEIPVADWTIAEELNKDRSGEIEIDYQVIKTIADTYGVTPKYILSASYREVYIYDEDKNLVYGGYVNEVNTSKTEKGEKTYKVTTKGFFNLLEKRLTNLVSEIKRVYTQQRASQIIKNLVAYTQSLAYGNLGIVNGQEAPDQSVLNDRTFKYDTIKSAIEKLGNNETWDGVDFEITSQKILNTYFPTKGSQKEDFELVDGFNILSYEIKEKMINSMANQVAVCGDGQGDEMLAVQRDADDTYKQTFFLLQEAIGEKSEKLVTTLERKGDKYLDSNKFPRLNIQVTVDYGEPIYQNYDIGDSITIKIPDEEINGYYRLIKRELKQDGTVVLTFLES